MGAMVRAAGLRGLRGLIDELGGSGAPMLARFGIEPAAPDSDDAVISSLSAGRVLEVAAAELDCPDLGLRLAARQDIAILGPLAIAIENSATLGDALDCATRFLFVHSPVLTVAQVADPSGRPGVVGLRYGSTELNPLPPQIADNGLGLLHRIIVLLGGGRYGLRSVHLPHRPLVPVARYTEFFGADVRFGQDAAVLRVPAALTEARVAGGNRVLREVALDYMRSHYPVPERTLAERVRLLLTQSLGSAPAGIAAVGRSLGLHPRTLQRRLAEESTSFDAILDDVRRQAAHRLITGTELPFSQITAMVGLAEQSALSRAVRRWYGLSPRELRRGY
ncbi:AraC family transcriptional regulator [Paractinoplanes rishiriensis]|uniref:HTH-type transcriptional regulator VirS n=1 Tax=Paractinoplanes rishiriensis TaxID=1050105 RepID=A0A919JWN6_9ACTN|nr:AraC family transcriptional regulator [Actinoplanes rishiriensis]GIE94677.1 HTH-type transcriptional regulator VirS [Actinoplanes rishiriensis]